MSIQSTQQGPSGIRIASVDADPQVGLQSTFYTALQGKANSQIGSIYNISVTPVSQASVGGFNYVWQDQSQNFNLGTFDYVNGRVAPAAGPAVVLSDPFSTDYAQLLSEITFGYSKADAQKLNQAATAASAQAMSIVSQYEEIYGPITKAMMTGVNVATPIDYVMHYVVAQQWSGTPKPISLVALEQARNLETLLPDMPASGSALLPLIAVYLGMKSGVLPLEDLTTNATWVLRTLAANNVPPSPTYPGMTTADPNTGTAATHVGYGISSAVAAIENDLANTSRTLSLSLQTSQSSSSTVQVSMSGSGGFDVPIDWFMGLGGGGSSSFNMYSYQGTGTSASVQLTFAGFTYVPVAPDQFQSDTGSGWFSASVLAQAARNFGQDVTGYTFTEAPQWSLGAGGELGMVTGVVIANFPTLTVNYSTGDWSSFSQQFQQQSSTSVSFLGIPVASFSESTYTASAQQNSEGGGFSITFTPSQEILSVPDMQKQAYVLGITVAYPGTGTV